MRTVCSCEVISSNLKQGMPVTWQQHMHVSVGHGSSCMQLAEALCLDEEHRLY